MKKPKLMESVNLDIPDTQDTQFKSLYPNLYEALSRPKGEDMRTRERHSLFVVWEDGCFRICARDRQEGCEIWVSCVKFLDCLGLVEVAVGTGEGTWKPIPQKGKKKRA